MGNKTAKEATLAGFLGIYRNRRLPQVNVWRSLQECHYPGGGGKEVPLRAPIQLWSVLWYNYRPPFGHSSANRNYVIPTKSLSVCMSFSWTVPLGRTKIIFLS